MEKCQIKMQRNF